MDDIIVASNSSSHIHDFKTVLHQTFKIKDMGLLKFFLGLEVTRSAAGITVCQRKYAFETSEDSGFWGCKAVNFPMESNLKLVNITTGLLPDSTSYRRLIGRFYFFCTYAFEVLICNPSLWWLESPRVSNSLA
ncbi:uncharacterized mitochondrial protein AtMg00810-like [Tripterygium wilfordii]|uniref:uncharacterized mitochondrial protein AtMg00810-like n=1 Tax=Tripterygium wilfordii TaxID=458696 RepID=UPI0018F857D7|nr:uncharacterized mitochondrial protein AtMg00810-like [Tripterygium wilfordii]